MPEKEIYRYDIVIDVNNEEAARRAKAAEEKINKTFDRIQKQGRNLNNMKAAPTVRLIDRFTANAKKIETTLHKIANKTVTVAVKAKDMTGGILGKLTSPLGMLGAGAGVYGLGKVTLGAAMDFETQMVSMEHWLKGNKARAKDFVGWLDTLAAKTPFEMDDLFPAASRAVGVSKGDVSMAERLVQLSADMAGLQPGKTVQDAMEALADAKMGEFERMKEFNMAFSKEQMDAVGGFAGFLVQAESMFAGGADKLSRTAKGRLSTIVDLFKTQFRSVGQGMLGALNPRLEKISDWFNKNPDTVIMWRNRLVQLGRDTFERMLSWGERAFERLKKIIDDPGFRNADWGGKVGILLNGMTASMTNWLAGPGGEALVALGASMGKIMGEAMISAFSGIMMDNPILRTVLMAYAGYRVGGIPGALTAMTASGVMEVPIQSAKSGERKAEEQRQEMVNFNNPQTLQGDFMLQSHQETLGEKVSSIFRNFQSKVRGEKKQAFGDIITSPTHALIGEAGPELVLPLSQRMRSRSLDLWQQAGQYLGVSPFAEGGFAGHMPAMEGIGGTTVINIYMDGAVEVINSSDAGTTVDQVASVITRKLKDVFTNKT